MGLVGGGDVGLWSFLNEISLRRALEPEHAYHLDQPGLSMAWATVQLREPPAAQPFHSVRVSTSTLFLPASRLLVWWFGAWASRWRWPSYCCASQIGRLQRTSGHRRESRQCLKQRERERERERERVKNSTVQHSPRGMPRSITFPVTLKQTLLCDFKPWSSLEPMPFGIVAFVNAS